MASSYECLRRGTLLRHCGCPRLAPRGQAERPAKEPGTSRQSTLDPWLRGQRAGPPPPRAAPPPPQSSGGEPRFSVSCP
eukprot:14013603-Alexandrium_andersonii.AAC.1